MGKYSPAFKAKMVHKMLLPGGISANALSSQVGVSQGALSRWLREARNGQSMAKKNHKKWTASEKFRVIAAASELSDEDLGELLRREGVHEARLQEWRETAEGALQARPRKRGASAEEKKIKALERELRRKEKALAEAAALLVLQKKMQAYLAGEDIYTTEKPEE